MRIQPLHRPPGRAAFYPGFRRLCGSSHFARGGPGPVQRLGINQVLLAPDDCQRAGADFCTDYRGAAAESNDLAGCVHCALLRRAALLRDDSAAAAGDAAEGAAREKRA
ncbi:hypothetical protein D3C81_1365700 [compost metagenome]